MRKWLLYGLPVAVVLGSACSGDDPGPGLGTTSGLGPSCAMFIDPTTVGVGGDLTCVDPNADTDMDGIPDVQEGSGDADNDGIPAHLDPTEMVVVNPPTGDGGVTTGGTMGGTTVLPPTNAPYIEDATDESNLDQGTIDELKGGGGNCSHNVLYPYDGTVFPAGLISPTIMWAENADAAYVHLSYDMLDTLDFEYAMGSSAPGEMQIPQNHWNEIVRRSQNTALKVKMTVKSGGSLSTCEMSWRVAPGIMTGSIYYNTYNHPQANGVGAVMRLRLGNDAAEVYQTSPGGVPPAGPCRSCHSVSANGSTLVSSEHLYFPSSFGTDSYSLTEAPNPPMTATIENATFGGLTPDGSKILAMGNPDCTQGADTFPRSANNFPLIEGPDHARLLDTSNGQELSATGLQADWYMWMPQFSPDGDKVVFNHAKPGSGGTDRRTLAWMSYDEATNTFGAPQNLVPTADGLLGPAPTLAYTPDSAAPAGLGALGVTNILFGPDGCAGTAGNKGALDPGVCEGPCYPAWPFFTPDGDGVIFALINEPDFMSAMPGRTEPAQSELWYVDLRDGAYTRLENANKGLAPGDNLLNYFPTVLPVQVGGYYWVFWTSTRAWGHKDFESLTLAFDDSYVEAVKKRIWVSAIRPRQGAGGEFDSLPPLVDPSFPAFYLEGQSDTGNVRAFAALNPCLEEGNTCTSGLDCCTGYCKIEPKAESGVCTAEPPPCAAINEKCDDAVPCCEPESDSDPVPQCLGGFCGFVNVL